MEIIIEKEADVIAVRQAVRSQAQKDGFSSFATSAIVATASELARNVWVHAGTGKFVLSIIHRGVNSGLQLEFIDEGPGIADLEGILQRRMSVGNSLGLGLSGAKRLADEFDVDSKPGQGTKIVVRKWKA